MRTVSGERYQCDGSGPIRVCLPNGAAADLDVLVVMEKPLGFDLVLGMDGIEALGGVTLVNSSQVQFGGELNCAAVQLTKPEPTEPELTESEPLKQGVMNPEQTNMETGLSGNESRVKVHVDEADFQASYDEKDKKWTMSWKWADGSAPEALRDTVSEYKIPPESREEYEEELKQWVENGWLEPYDEEKQGPPKGTIPLMAVLNRNKEKVRPVLDFRQLNSFVDAHTADADVCAEKLREWRKRGTDGAMIDLRKAYLQVHVDESLWPYQTVVFHGRRYSLTRLGFGLSVGPLVLKKVLATILSWDADIRRATSAYIDDIFVDESAVPAERVVAHLKKHGLDCKPPERLSGGTRVLGLRVQEGDGHLVWRRDNTVGDVPEPLTKRALFSLCGRLVSHLPVCGWLRPAASFMKRVANATTTSWDEPVTDPKILKMLEEVMQRVDAADPARGRWDVDGEDATVWVDASSLALGAVVQIGGEVVEDACWLRRDECAHINMAELDAALKGINLVIPWGVKTVKLMTDSRTVYHWLSDAISGKARVKTKAAGEMLIRRRLETIRSTVEEYGLQVDVSFVTSRENRADALTRVPQKWLAPTSDGSAVRVEVGGADQRSDGGVAAAAASRDNSDEIRRIHDSTGHPGIRRTFYFCKKSVPAVTKSQVRAVVHQCQQCLSLDPAPVRWCKGDLSVPETWTRLSMDITHVNGGQYLTVIDNGPSRFAVWRKLKRQDSSSVIEQLEQIFFERGAPREILTDNAAAFRSRAFSEFSERWGVTMRFRSAHRPSGNGIVERCHRTVKCIVARSSCSVQEALYWYNVTPKDDVSAESAPANQIYRYEVKIRGIDENSSDPGVVVCRFSLGDRVWVRDPNTRCDVPSSVGTVTKVVSAQTVEVDSIPRHVRDLRQASTDCTQESEPKYEREEPGEDAEESWLIQIPAPRTTGGCEQINDADGASQLECEVSQATAAEVNETESADSPASAVVRQMPAKTCSVRTRQGHCSICL